MLEMKSHFSLPSQEVEALMRDQILIQIHSQMFDPWTHLVAWSSQTAALATFIGRVRDVGGDGHPLDALELTHYPQMCEAMIRREATRLLVEHGASSALVLHRVGRLSPSEVIVLVAVEADRRGPAQRCCTALLEAIKHQAPFWKREWRDGQGIWLEANTPLELEG